MTLTHGELFAGVGGFGLGFEAAGIDTVWACEIDPPARAVFSRHWPDVPLHTDVRTISGYALEPVDVISFGSPCQDLSIAGARRGLDGDRSNLFFEACRIIEEMRDATRLRFPRWAVWENVAGALSSAAGADFGRALDELADIGAVVIEWNVLNAIHFGVPQRRRRIFVVACFDPRADGLGEVLPVTEGLPWGLGSGITSRPGAAQGTRGGPIADRGVVQSLTGAFGKAGVDAGQAQAGWLVPDDVGTLQASGTNQRGWRAGADEAAAGHVIPALTTRCGNTQDDQQTTQLVAFGIGENQRGEVLMTEEYVRQIAAGGGKPGQGYSAVFSIYPESGQGADLTAVETDYAPSLNVTDGEKMTDRGLRIVQPIEAESDAQEHEGAEEPQVPVLRHSARPEAVRERPARGLDGLPEEEVLRPDLHGERFHEEEEPQTFDWQAGGTSDDTWQGKSRIWVEDKPGATRSLSTTKTLAVNQRMGVRRLTPRECERLMGWPDDHTRWTEHDVELADSVRYRLVGNGVVATVTAWIGKHLVRCTQLLDELRYTE